MYKDNRDIRDRGYVGPLILEAEPNFWNPVSELEALENILFIMEMDLKTFEERGNDAYDEIINKRIGECYRLINKVYETLYTKHLIVKMPRLVKLKK